MSKVGLSTVSWRKSSYSGSEGGNCVEVAEVAAVVAVRDSKDPDGPKLVFGRAAFETLARDIRAGRYDRQPAPRQHPATPNDTLEGLTSTPDVRPSSSRRPDAGAGAASPKVRRMR